jgi:hypothetical protein
MNKTLLISEEYLKKTSTISLNVETFLLRQSILDAQNLHLQDVLGTSLMEKIQNLVTDSTIEEEVNAKYKALLDGYIVDVVSRWAVVECLPNIRFKIMNKSVTVQDSEDSVAADINEFKYFQKILSNKAEFYSQRLTKYLQVNNTWYPEYYESRTFDETYPKTDQYFSGIQFDDVYCVKNTNDDDCIY